MSEATSFLVVPNEASTKKFKSSQETKDAVCRLLKPANYALKINKILMVRNNGVRIVASYPDIGKIKADTKLAKARLKVLEDVKLNPRLIVYGVPLNLSHAAIRNEIVAQNFEREDDADLKVVYIYPPKQDRSTTNCIIEVSPVRKRLQAYKRIYIGFSACGFADYVRIIQCYKCLSFGHYAADCNSEPLCGHCSGKHELRACKNKKSVSKCANCVRDQSSVRDVDHSALDIKKCPVLIRRIKNKIFNINYG